MRAFVITLRQSLELGTDIGDALRVFSDEMRAKRLLRAEETANKLPVKMVLPLGGVHFPSHFDADIVPGHTQIVGRNAAKMALVRHKMLLFCNNLLIFQLFPCDFSHLAGGDTCL